MKMNSWHIYRRLSSDLQTNCTNTSRRHIKYTNQVWNFGIVIGQEIYT